MDLAGKMCTLYPFSTQGAVLTQKIDMGPIAGTFHGALVAELTKAGLDVRMPVAGTPDQPIVVRGQFVRADGGSRIMRYFFTFFAGAAVFEAEGAVGDAGAPFAQLHAASKRRAGFGGGDSAALLNDAARLAGQEIGKQVVTTLAAR